MLIEIRGNIKITINRNVFLKLKFKKFKDETSFCRRRSLTVTKENKRSR